MKFLHDKKKLKFCNLILFNHDSIYRKKTFLIPRLIKFAKKKIIKIWKKYLKKTS